MRHPRVLIPSAAVLALRYSTAGNSSDRMNSRWSGPVQMCQTPSTTKLLNWFQRSGSRRSSVAVGVFGPSTAPPRVRP